MNTEHNGIALYIDPALLVAPQQDEILGNMLSAFVQFQDSTLYDGAPRYTVLSLVSFYAMQACARCSSDVPQDERIDRSALLADIQATVCAVLHGIANDDAQAKVLAKMFALNVLSSMGYAIGELVQGTPENATKH